jgi:hypothetical protein
MKVKALNFFVFFLSLFVVYNTLIVGKIASQESDVADIVQNVIFSQLTAFKENQLEKAYSFAAPNIKKQFPDYKIFGLMVKNGYPVIWKPKSYKFTKFSTNGSRSIQRVLFYSYDNKLLSYDYLLVKFDTHWKISGVIPVKAEEST